MKTVLLLLISNIFMTFAWYGHLRFKETALWKVILVSWLIAFFEYCFQVPANRIGHGQFTAFQLKTNHAGGVHRLLGAVPARGGEVEPHRGFYTYTGRYLLWPQDVVTPDL